MTAFAPLASTPLSAAPTGATIYLAAFESAQTATWTYADIGNGRNGFSATGYAASGSTTSGVPTSGSGDDTSVGITLSGLTAGTAYKIWLIWDDGTNTSNSGSPVGSAEFKTPYLLSAESGTFALTGNAASLLAQRVLSAETGSFTLTGNAANLAKTTVLFADPGTFALTGNNATLTKTGGSGDAAAIWNYIFSNGLTAEDTLVAINEKLSTQGGILTVGKFLGLK